MATWNTITQTGGPQRWTVWGGNITNHEAFAFTLQSSENNVGALISDVTVYVDQGGAGGEPSYNITLSAVDQFANSVDQGITGNFESNGV
ncbi:MAG TPA: hypothetical protein VK695_13670 [Steroidobacteraceae bacterium]|jgi:hypothetical protein|nr:hypothetical protein [Steroidobacteraceae bacterium]